MIFSLYYLLAALVIQAPLALAMNNMSVPFFNPTQGGGSMLDNAGEYQQVTQNIVWYYEVVWDDSSGPTRRATQCHNLRPKLTSSPY